MQESTENKEWVKVVINDGSLKVNVGTVSDKIGSE